jgi:hypothetical protein
MPDRSDGCRQPHWRLYAERGLPGEHAAVWLYGENLTLEFADEPLAAYKVMYAPDGLHVAAVEEYPVTFALRLMHKDFGFIQQETTCLPEVGFLLILIAGVWLVAAEIIPPFKLARARRIVAGVLLAISGDLLIIATCWGGFG